MLTVEERVVDVVREQLGIPAEQEINAQSVLGAPEGEGGLDADSLEVIEIVAELEKVYNIDIPEERWEPARTVGDLIAVVQSLIPCEAK